MINLISLPAAPQVEKRVITQPTNQEPLVVPPAQKAKKILKQKAEKGPKPEIMLHNISEPIIPQAAVPVLESQTSVVPEFEPSEDQPTATVDKITVEFSIEEAQGEAQVASTTAGDNRLEIYSNLVRERINKVKRYPLMARKAGKEGVVVVGFSLDRRGKILNSQLINSCGTKALDRAALKAVKRAGPFAKLPGNLKSPHNFTVQINFLLEG